MSKGKIPIVGQKNNLTQFFLRCFFAGQYDFIYRFIAFPPLYYYNLTCDVIIMKISALISTMDYITEIRTVRTVLLMS